VCCLSARHVGTSPTVAYDDIAIDRSRKPDHVCFRGENRKSHFSRFRWTMVFGPPIITNFSFAKIRPLRASLSLCQREPIGHKDTHGHPGCTVNEHSRQAWDLTKETRRCVVRPQPSARRLLRPDLASRVWLLGARNVPTATARQLFRPAASNTLLFRAMWTPCCHRRRGLYRTLPRQNPPLYSKFRPLENAKEKVAYRTIGA